MLSGIICITCNRYISKHLHEWYSRYHLFPHVSAAVHAATLSHVMQVPAVFNVNHTGGNLNLTLVCRIMQDHADSRIMQDVVVFCNINKLSTTANLSLLSFPVLYKWTFSIVNKSSSFPRILLK